MRANSDVDFSQSSKSGGDAVGSAGLSAGSATGVGEGFAVGGWGADAYAEGYGSGDAGNAYASQNAGAATGGDVSDNTSIGSVNINS